MFNRNGTNREKMAGKCWNIAKRTTKSLQTLFRNIKTSEDPRRGKKTITNYVVIEKKKRRQIIRNETQSQYR